MLMRVTQSIDLAPLSFLLVDDNRHMRTILGSVLKSVGVHRLREADDGVDALEILRQCPVDIVIVDYNMRQIDGIEFAGIVRKACGTRNPYLPLIMASGHSEWSRIVEARDAGINEFVVKPLKPKVLLDRVLNVILRPRPFVRCNSFFGPDRRRKSAAQHSGPFRRATDGAI